MKSFAFILLLGSTAVDFSYLQPPRRYIDVELLSKNTMFIEQLSQICNNGRWTLVTRKVEGSIQALRANKTNHFSKNDWKNRLALLDGESDDEQGQMVSSAFGGKLVDWNFVPLHKNEERTVNAHGSILNRWDEFFEKWVRNQFAYGASIVTFTIRINYLVSGCRPVSFDIFASSNRGSFKRRYTNGPMGSIHIPLDPEPYFRQKTPDTAKILDGMDDQIKRNNNVRLLMKND